MKKASLECKDHPDLVALLALKVPKEVLAILASLDPTASPANKDPRVTPVKTDWTGVKEKRVRQERLGLVARWDCPDRLENRVLKGRPEFRATLVCPEKKEIRELPAYLVPWELLVNKGCQDLKVLQDFAEDLDQR